MRAVQIAQFGGPEVMELADVPVPEPTGSFGFTQADFPFVPEGTRHVDATVTYDGEVVCATSYDYPT